LVILDLLEQKVNRVQEDYKGILVIRGNRVKKEKEEETVTLVSKVNAVILDLEGIQEKEENKVSLV
jgi:hypothetical protein